MLRSLDNLIPYKILAVYQCGSTAYGLNNETSDEDYTVIVDNYCGADIIKDDANPVKNHRSAAGIRKK